MNLKNKVLSVLITLIMVITLSVPVTIVSSAEGENETVADLLNGSISVEYTDISEYRTNGNFTYPTRNGYLFAGWFLSSDCSGDAISPSYVSGMNIEGKIWAKFVPENVLGVRTQAESGVDFNSDKTNLRFVTGIDSKRYSSVGFDFEIGNKKYYNQIGTYTSELTALDKEGNLIETYTADVFGTASKLLVSTVAKNIPNSLFSTGIKVTPYWVTLDGTRVSGKTVIKTVNAVYTKYAAGFTANEVGSIAYPSNDKWNTYTEGSVGAQGGAFDGTYYYQAIVRKLTDSNAENYYTDLRDASGNLKYEINQDDNEVIIQKYSLDSDGKMQLESESLSLPLRHANNIAYNSNIEYSENGVTKKGLLVVSYCGNYNTSKQYLGFIDPDSLTIVSPRKIDIAWSDSIIINDEYIDTNLKIASIEYNSLRNQYLVGLSGGTGIAVLDGNFGITETVFSLDKNANSNYVGQSVGADDGYIYYVYSTNTSDTKYFKNMVSIFDWNGNFINTVELGIDYNYEAESISIRNNQMYISANVLNTCTKIFKINGVNNFTSDKSTGKSLLTLSRNSVENVYAETEVSVTDTKTGVTPYAGIRLTGKNGTVDFVVAFNNRSSEEQQIIATDARVETVIGETVTSKPQYAFNSDVLNLKSGDKIKLAVAKFADEFYFYVNGILQSKETINDFVEIDSDSTTEGNNIISSVSLYSKYTNASFENYRVAEGYNNVGIALSDLNNDFTVYRNRNTGKSGFDVQNSAAENPYVTGKAQAWANDAVFFNNDTSSNFRVTTKVSSMTLTENGAAGIAFTSDETLYYVGVSDYSGTVVLRLAGTTLGYNTLKTVKSENTDIQKSGEYTITVERIGASLKAYLNNADTPQISLDLTTQTIYPLSSANVKSKVGFYVETGTTATFSKYDYQILSDVANKGYTKTIVNNANDFYAETTVKTVKCSTSVWPCAGLRIYNGTNHIDFVTLYNQSETPSFSRAYIGYLETGSSEVQENINLSTITDKLNNGTGVKFAVAKLNGVIYFFIDNVLIAKREYPAFKDAAFAAEATYGVQIYSKGTTSYFENSDATTKNIEQKLANAITLDKHGIVDSLYGFNITTSLDSASKVLSVDSVTTNKTKGNHEIAIGESKRDVFAQAKINTLSKNDSSYARVGLRLTNSDGSKNVDLAIGFQNTESTVPYIMSVETNQSGVNSTSTDVSGTAKYYSKNLSGTDLTQLKNSYSTDGMNIAIAKKENVFYFYVDGMLVGTNTYEDFSADDVVTPKFYSKLTESTITDWNTSTPDSTVTLTGNIYIKDKATIESAVTQNEITNIPVTIKSSASKNRGYMYFNEKSTKVYAETYIDLPESATGDERVGLALMADDNKYIGFYIKANGGNSPNEFNSYFGIKDGSSNNSDDSAINWSNNKSVKNLQLERTGNKLAILRDGNVIRVYINDSQVYYGTLDNNYLDAEIPVDSETYVGLSTMQGSATYRNFKCLYGEEIKNR